MKPKQLQDALNDVKEEYIADAHTSAPATDSPTAATSVRKTTKKFRILTAAADTMGLIYWKTGCISPGSCRITWTNTHTHSEPQ